MYWPSDLLLRRKEVVRWRRIVFPDNGVHVGGILKFTNVIICGGGLNDNEVYLTESRI